MTEIYSPPLIDLSLSLTHTHSLTLSHTCFSRPLAMLTVSKGHQRSPKPPANEGYSGKAKRPPQNRARTAFILSFHLLPLTSPQPPPITYTQASLILSHPILTASQPLNPHSPPLPSPLPNLLPNPQLLLHTHPIPQYLPTNPPTSPPITSPLAPFLSSQNAQAHSPPPSPPRPSFSQPSPRERNETKRRVVWRGWRAVASVCRVRDVR